MVRAIAMTRCRGCAAKLGCDLVDRAERPVTAGGIEFEDRTRLHREAVINLWRRQHDSGSRWSGARSSLLRIGMFGVLSFQQAFPEQSLHLSAYGGARAAQAICDLCGRAHRPQGDKFSEFLIGPTGHGRPRSWRPQRLMPCLPIRAAPFWRRPSRRIGEGSGALANQRAPDNLSMRVIEFRVAAGHICDSGRWRGYRWGRNLLVSASLSWKMLRR